MKKSPTANIEESFQEITDPRTGNATRHIFIEILIIAICAIICGAEGGVILNYLAKRKKPGLKRF